MGLSEIHERISCIRRAVPFKEIAMLNRAIVAAFIATSAAAFGIASVAAADKGCESARPAERVERPGAKPLGPVETPAPGEDRRTLPRTVRA